MCEGDNELLPGRKDMHAVAAEGDFADNKASDIRRVEPLISYTAQNRWHYFMIRAAKFLLLTLNRRFLEFLRRSCTRVLFLGTTGSFSTQR
jgi:hypothetical protein